MIDKQANKENQIQILKMENKELQARIFKLEKAITLLEGTNKQLEGTTKKLIEEIQFLKEKLGLNSTNSSLPPSRDLYKQKRIIA